VWEGDHVADNFCLDNWSHQLLPEEQEVESELTVVELELIQAGQ
jgi:hypothetical protein